MATNSEDLTNDQIVLAVSQVLDEHKYSGDSDRDEELIDYLYVLFEVEQS